MRDVYLLCERIEPIVLLLQEVPGTRREDEDESGLVFGWTWMRMRNGKDPILCVLL